ncbi:hypothetical protein [Pseudanabaena sp. SR411]|uniref:hypothetical protein n=1 Tax=Pseudanabaena sp. SR411 TaxID=1980935 RepID=UPI0015960012|nr:hypothetical protein [Pseudanabaena sp. SR411]
MERDRLTRDKDRGITNNPNEQSSDRATSSTSLSAIVRVSVVSVKIVNSLPPLQEK